MGINVKDPLNSDLFTKGFVNDETPLDEYNLNLILAAINLINENTNTIDKSQKDADKAMNQAVFGEDHPPEDATPLQTQVEALQTQVSGKENTFDVIITDGGGVPPSVINGTNPTWNGEFEEV